jgi:hypothetical protein
MINKYFKNDNLKLLLGIIWGIGLACIFRCACNGRKCIILKAPKPKEVEKNIYGFDNKCYKYKSETTPCTDDAIE